MYKGFDKDLKCRGFKYEVGGEYREEKADLCRMGFHACENPIDTFGYYPPADSRYCEVELVDMSDETSSDDSKRVGKGIKIGGKIGIKGIIDAFIKFTFEKIDWGNSAATNTGDGSAATNTGNRSAASVEGKESVAIVTGIEGIAAGALGCWIVVTERGEWNGEAYPIKCIKTAKVDGKKIKADTYYKVVDGEFVEV